MEEVSRLINEKSKEIKSLNFNFVQTTYIAESTQTVKAQVVFKKPDKIRISYSEPREQIVIYNAGFLYTYIPEIRQMTKQKAPDMDQILGVSPSLILSPGSIKELKKKYNLKAENKNGTIVLNAEPVGNGSFDEMKIYINAEKMLPEKTVVTAPNLISETDFEYRQLNPEISEEVFSITESEEVNLIEIE